MTVDAAEMDRVAIVIVSEREVLRMFTSGRREYLRLPMIKGVPEDVEAMAVNYDYMRRSFAFRVYHRSFDRVMPGMMTPVCSGDVEMRTYCLKGIDDDRGDEQG